MKNESEKSWRQAMVTAGIALSLPGTIAGPALLGYYLDGKYATGPLWLMVGLFVGLASAVFELIVLTKKMGQIK